MERWDDARAARGQLIWMLVAFLAGAALVLFGKPAPTPPPAILWPQPLQAPTLGPTPIPSPPAAVATSTARTRVVIERPVYPPGYRVPVPGETIVPGAATVAIATPGIERIVIESDAGSTAVAPIVTPAPPVQQAAQAPSGLGITVGPFPGKFALSYAPVQVEVLGLVRAGPSIILNMSHIGVGGAVAMPRLSPRLYFEGGIGQEFKPVPDPQPYFGVGWRF